MIASQRTARPQIRAVDAFEGVPLSQVFTGGKTPAAELQFDVCVVGSGPGGATAAAFAARAGLRTLLVEEGPFARAQDFSSAEIDATALYQDHMSRRTADGSITILQGRAVGGSSTLNWTSSFRAPEQTLRHWREVYNLSLADAALLAPEFDKVEDNLGVTVWSGPNANNALIAAGCRKLGWHWGMIPRNVRGCWNLGLCGLGCPTNAKQSALVTEVKDFIVAGGTLLADARAEQVLIEGSRAIGIRLAVGAHSVTIRANRIVLSCGAIGTPALLLRSGLGQVNDRIGRRTFLHPVVTVFAKFSERVEPWAGAPQSVYSDEFLWPAGETTPGFKIETMPLLPMFAAGLAAFTGERYSKTLGDLANVQGSMALQRDGFDPRSPGGVVTIDERGRPSLSYELTSYQFEGFRSALLALSEMQFAAGAREIIPVHLGGRFCRSFAEAKAHINDLPMEAYSLRVGSAHVMGGCGMSLDPGRGAVDNAGRLHGCEGLYVMDGSLFPTSLGANPQITIYALARRLSLQLFGPAGLPQRGEASGN